MIEDKDAKKSLENIDEKAKETESSMTDSFNSIAKGAAAFAAAVGTAAIASYKMAMSFSNDADVIDKTSLKLGITTDAFQELRYAMGQMGISGSRVERGLGRLNQRIGRAAQGNDKYAEALYKLGFSYEEVQNGTLDTEEAFMRAIDTLHNMENATDQSALASELFGTRMARDLMPAIAAGTESIDELRQRAHELGGVMSEENVEAGVLFADTVDSVKFAVRGLFYEIIEDALPAMQEMAEYLMNNAPMIAEKVEDSMSGITTAISKVWGLIRKYPKAALTAFGAAVATVGAAVTLWLGKIAAAWMVTQAKTAAAIAKAIVHMGLLMVKYAALGVAALVHAAKVAASWLIAMGPIGLVIAAVLGLVALIVDNWDTIVEATQWLWGKIKTIFTTVFDFMKDLFLRFHPIGILIDNWDAVSGFFSDLWGKVTGVVSKAFGKLKEILTSVLPMPLLRSAWEKVTDFFGKIWGGVLKGLNAFKEDFKDAWGEFVEIVKVPLNIVVALLNSMLSGFEKMINALADGINGLPEFEIPGWVPKIGGGTFGLPEIPEASLPKIPALARGGNVQRSGAALVGEAGPELLEVNRGARVTPLQESPGNLSTGKDTANIYVELDGRLLAKALGKPLVDQIRLRSGVRI